MSPQTQRNPYEIHWQLNELGNRLVSPATAPAAASARARQATPAPHRPTGRATNRRGRAA